MTAAWRRVLKIQTKLHQWASDDPDRRFDDLFNLVCDPAVLVVAWQRVRSNQGRAIGRGGWRDCLLRRDRARRAGLPRRAARRLKAADVPPAARAGADDPQAGRQAPATGHPHRAGPGGAGRPADWCWSRSSRRTSSRVPTVSAPGAEPRTPSPRSTIFASRSYEWVLEGDIKACFDEISHSALMDRVRSTDRGQACPGPGEGVPQGRDPR